jgi:hypothetical protein
MRDVSKLWSAGYALGASFENTLVVSEDRVLNPEGLYYITKSGPAETMINAIRKGAGPAQNAAAGE